MVGSRLLGRIDGRRSPQTLCHREQAMDPKWVTASAAFTGVVFGACGFVWAMYTWLKEVHRNKVNNHLQSLCNLYEKTEIVTLLKCHGIDPDDLSRAGVHPDELIYLLINFTVSRVHHHSRLSAPEGPFRKDSYRYNLCKSPVTRKAFPFLRQVFGDVEISDRIEATLREIQQTDAGDESPE